MPRPIVATKQTVEQIFDGAAPLYDRSGPALFRQFGERLVELMNIPPGSRLLDVGTGTGAVLIPAANQVGAQGQVVGVDLSNEMLAQAHRAVTAANLSNVQLGRMDAERLEFPDGSFDAVIAGFSIFFCPNMVAALSEAFRVARPEGRLGLTMWSKNPPPFDPAWKIFADLVRKYDVEVRMPQKVAYSPQEVQDMISGVGFQETKIVTETTDVVYPTIDDWWEFQMTMGTRAAILSMSEEMRTQFKQEYLEQLRSLFRTDGLHLPAPVMYAFGKRP